MKRRTLDIIISGGGLMVAALLAVLAFAVATQYAFATDYVRTELGSQKIVFATADKLTDHEKTWAAGSTCLVEYAGQPLDSGAKAECYAKYYIRAHMTKSATDAGWPGATYATLGTIRSDLTAQVAAAKQKGDTAGAADLQKRVDAATSLRSTMQTGETLSGLLLTTYGFSVLGDMAGLASSVLYALAAVMLVVSIAGFIHALVTPKDEVFLGSVIKKAALPDPA
jgi:hypothetical protein